MMKFEVGDLVKVRDCVYGKNHKCVGFSGEIIQEDYGDYYVRLDNHPPSKAGWIFYELELEPDNSQIIE